MIKPVEIIEKIKYEASPIPIKTARLTFVFTINKRDNTKNTTSISLNICRFCSK